MELESIMEKNKEEGGCLKLIIGVIIMGIVGALVLFVIAPLAIAITPALLIGFFLLVIIVGIVDTFSN